LPEREQAVAAAVTHYSLKVMEGARFGLVGCGDATSDADGGGDPSSAPSRDGVSEPSPPLG
jgi:hypothetical protein